MAVEEFLEVVLNGVANVLGLCVDLETIPNCCNASWGEPLAIAFDKADTAGSLRWKVWMEAKSWDSDVVAVAKFEDCFTLLCF